MCSPFLTPWAFLTRDASNGLLDFRQDIFLIERKEHLSSLGFTTLGMIGIRRCHAECHFALPTVMTMRFPQLFVPLEHVLLHVGGTSVPSMKSDR